MRIDVHTHIISSELPDFSKRFNESGWPVFQPTCSCGAKIMVDGKVFREITENTWDINKRIEDMKRTGVDKQVLSPIPVTFSYWANPQHAMEMSRFQNEHIASVVKQDPDHFLGFGTIPLQDVDAAIQEMDYCIHTLGLHGLEIGSNVNGKNLDDPSFYPFFEMAEKWNVPLSIHPWQILGRERLQAYNSLYTVGMPGETALAGASLIFSGVMEKLPNLKVLLAHGGGSLPYILPRMDHGWENWTHLQELISQPPSYYAKKFYYDSLVFDPVNLKYLIDKFGDQKIMLGTDYPFKMAEIPAGKILQESIQLTEEQKNAIFGLNAMEFLGLKTIQPK